MIVAVMTHHFPPDHVLKHSITQVSVYSPAEQWIPTGEDELPEYLKTYTWKCSCGKAIEIPLPADKASDNFNFHTSFNLQDAWGARAYSEFFTRLASYQLAAGHYVEEEDSQEEPDQNTASPDPQSVGLRSTLEKIINERIEARHQLGSLDPVSDGAKDAADAIFDLFPHREPGKPKHTKHSRRTS